MSGYTTTAAIKTPGPLQNEGVLVEWTDSNPSNSTFEGTARELLRVQLNTRSHPLGDLIFNPAARRGDPDWRVLYIECGDGASGESTHRGDPVQPAAARQPRRQDSPHHSRSERARRRRAPSARTAAIAFRTTTRLSSTPGARKEIWAYGFRNPHRLNWAVDPANPANNRLIANSVGLHTWETVYIVHKGANYGYALREGTELLKDDNTTGPLPAVDKIPVQVGEQPTDDMVVPTYPVIQYGHGPKGGDSIGSGFVYNGKAIPGAARQVRLHRPHDRPHLVRRLQGHAGRRRWQAETMAAIHEVRLRWNDPHDSPDAGSKVYDSMFPIVEAAYHARGGKSPKLPGPPGLVKAAAPTSGSRSTPAASCISTARATA